LHALENATLTDRLGAWGALFTGGAYGASSPDAVLLDGSTGYASFAGAGFPSSQAAFVVRAYTGADASNTKRALLAFAAQGLGTITVSLTGASYGLALTL
jgi:hypothetical protein